MKTVTEFPRETELLDPIFIEMSDGVRLAAKIWLPKDAGDNPVPAILEYLPYRRTDGTAARDETTHPYFAGHGYASIRVDMRGSGDSDGVLLGEYLKQEQDDALEVINWIVSQPWCAGAVGMIGISWGGFNGLQIAARKPDPLKAIVSICSTDDRYADDIHFMGGCMLLNNPGWHTNMFSINSTPPDPAKVGNRWKEIWMDRLQGSGFWLEEWLHHQRRDDFWKHGSVCENFGDIEAAVYAVGGWADGYSNAVFRLLDKLDAPCKGLVGPWAHKYPHFAKPGPEIGFLQECLRWWDHWLKEIDTGIKDEPQLRAWVEDPVPPRPYYDTRPGRWVAEDSWPSPNVTSKVMHLNAHGLGEVKGNAAGLQINSPMTVGTQAGQWCAYGLLPDLAGDQRIEAGGSLVFDTGPLEDGFDVLGAPVVELELQSDTEMAMVTVVLSDVMPDGAATRVSYGMLNLTHRDSHEEPTLLEPGKTYRVQVKLNDCGHRFELGQRIRVAVSTAYWPIVWPMPDKTTLTVSAGESTLRLPVRGERVEDAALAEFGRPEGSAPLNATMMAKPSYENTFTQDVVTGMVTQRQFTDEGLTVYNDHDGWTIGSTHEELMSVHPDDPLSAALDTTWTETFSRGAWEVSTRTRTQMSATKTHFIVHGEIEARMGDEIVHEQTWDAQVPRDHV